MRALERYLLHLATRGVSPGTRQVYRATLRRFLGSAEGCLDRHALRAYLASRAEVVRGGTLANELSVLRGFFCFVGSEEALEGVRVSRGAGAPPRYLGRKVVARLLRAAGTPRRGSARQRALAARDRALLEVLYGLGLRRVEACTLALADLDVGAGTARVRRAKRGRSALLPLPPGSLRALERYLEESRPALVAGARDTGHLLVGVRGRRLTPGGVSKIVRRASELAGVSVAPHDLRRAVATHLVEAGLSLREVQVFLGHSRLTSTARYVGVDFKALREAVEHLERLRAARRRGGPLPQ